MAVLRARFRGGAAGCGGGGVVVALALAPVASAALAVEASAKNGDDGKDVLGELELGGGGGGGVTVVCVHDDLRTVPAENVLEEIECEPAEPVFVGNVHRS